ncbi:MAG: Crp/Fnr family transcriptional regulator [Perlucidibaca sp.]
MRYISTMDEPMLPKNLHRQALRASLPSYGLDVVALGEWGSSLPPELLDKLRQLARPRDYRNGEVLFRKGEQAEGLYIIRSGEVRSSSVTEDGGEAVLYLFEPGSCVGLMSCLDGEPSPSTCRAYGDTSAYLIPRQQLLALLEAEPHYHQYFTRLMLRWVRGLLTLIEDQAVLGIRARMAKRLLQLAYIHGETVPGGVMIPLKLPQEELALILGATRQSVHQHLTDFRERGWIEIDKAVFTLVDITALQDCVAGSL